MRSVFVAVLLSLAPVWVTVPAEAASLRTSPEATGHGWSDVAEGQRAAQADHRAQRQRLRAALDRQIDDHLAALAGLFAAAERHEQEQVQRVEALAAVGYTGDADEAQVVLPLADYRLTASFGSIGTRWLSVHTGLDFAAPTGTPLVASGTGTVTSVGEAGAYGLRTVLTLTDGTELWYCHQLASLVVPGESVEIGTPIGLVGSSGNSTGPHLHLEVRPVTGVPVDPRTWFEAFGIYP